MAADGAEKKRIADAYAHFHRGNYYEVLGIERSAGEADVKKAYFQLARQWHPDVFAGKDLGDEAPKADEIFSKITDAYNTLSDAEKRAKYDDVIDGKAMDEDKAMAEAAVAVRAELEFQKGEILVKAGKFGEAEPYFRQAIKLKPNEADFWAYLGWSVYKKRQGDMNVNKLKGKAYLKKATEINADCDRALLYMGYIAKLEEKPAIAYDLFRRATIINPKNAEASREVKAYDNQTSRVLGKKSDSPAAAPAPEPPKEPEPEKKAPPGREKIDIQAALSQLKRRGES